MKKILVFCSNPVNGGTAAVFAEMCKEIQDREIQDIEIIPCIDKRNNVKIYRRLNNLVRLDIISESQALGNLKIGRKFLKRICERIIRNCRYSPMRKKNIKIMKEFLLMSHIDIVVIHNGGYIGDDLCNQMLEASYKANINKRIMVFHSDFKKGRLKKILCLPYDRKINKQATQTVTVSEFTRNRILDNSYLKSDMKVIFNGISFENQLLREEKMNKIRYENADVHIGVVGNFLRNKGQLEFLKAIYEILQNCEKKLQIFLIGNIYDLDYFGECKKFIDDHQMGGKISIFHNIFNAREYMEIFDFTVIPSIADESFGLIGVEAMRAGVPIVAFECGGIPEVVKNGVDGYIVKLGDTRALINAMQRLINSPLERIKMGNNAKRDYESRFTREIMGNRYLELVLEE